MSAPTVAVGAPPLVCPLCRTTLEARGDGAHRCPACTRTFPEVAGVPDLRLHGDRYLDLDGDRRKAESLAARDDLSFHELMALYWAGVPEVPAGLAARYAAAAADGLRRFDERLTRDGSPPPGSAALDVGCGTGALVIALARRGVDAVGVDLALRWLVVARRQSDEVGVATRFVAADGALLPFRAGSFTRVYSLHVLEHCADQRGVLHGCLRAAGAGGSASLVTTNRFSLAPEPTVGLFGVGFLPRRLAAPYVRVRRHTRYGFVRPLSRSELEAMCGPGAPVSIEAASLPSPGPGASPALRRGVAAYERLRRCSATRSLLSRIGPFLEVTGTRGPVVVDPSEKAWP